ncbi:MAG: hypothetical protein LAO31_21160 [Acidobacteriia bacterium]|nr:hypothetical protein [Terriglobia bacterium]
MIFQIATINIRHNRGGDFHLRIPLLLVWLLLLPVALLLLPAILIACLVRRVNPFRALVTFVRILAALRGTHVEVGEGERSVLVDIS